MCIRHGAVSTLSTNALKINTDIAQSADNASAWSKIWGVKGHLRSKWKPYWLAFNISSLLLPGPLAGIFVQGDGGGDRHIKAFGLPPLWQPDLCDVTGFSVVR